MLSCLRWHRRKQEPLTKAAAVAAIGDSSCSISCEQEHRALCAADAPVADLEDAHSQLEAAHRQQAGSQTQSNLLHTWAEASQHPRTLRALSVCGMLVYSGTFGLVFLSNLPKLPAAQRWVVGACAVIAQPSCLLQVALLIIFGPQAGNTHMIIFRANAALFMVYSFYPVGAMLIGPSRWHPFGSRLFFLASLTLMSFSVILSGICGVLPCEQPLRQRSLWLIMMTALLRTLRMSDMVRPGSHNIQATKIYFSCPADLSPLAMIIVVA